MFQHFFSIYFGDKDWYYSMVHDVYYKVRDKLLEEGIANYKTISQRFEDKDIFGERKITLVTKT